MPEPIALPGDQAATQDVVRLAIRRFALSSLACLLLVLAGAVVVGSKYAEREALHDAEARASAIAESIAGPLINRGVRTRDPQAVATLASAMHGRMVGDSLRYVKLWAADGSVIWSTQTELVGQVYPLEEDVTALFGTRKATASLSTLTKAENVAEIREGERELLEVYAGAFDADDQPVVFEAYITTDQMRADQHATVVKLMLLTVPAVVLLLAMLLPLAVSLARRVQRGQAERDKLVGHALRAAELERRRLAQDLHDGVIQDLSGVAYALPAVAHSLPEGPDGDHARLTLGRLSGIIGRDVGALRTMLLDLTPPDLRGEEGLRDALEDLAARTRAEGLEVGVRVDAVLPVPMASLVYRVVREGLRNVVKHASASRVQVHVGLREGQVEVVVRDDGARDAGPGQAPSTATTDAGNGQGLRLLADTVADVGGVLTFDRSSGGTLTCTLPGDAALPLPTSTPAAR